MLSEEDDRERNRIVDSMTRRLRSTAEGGFVASNTVIVIEELKRGLDYGRITAEQRDQLLRMLIVARPNIIGLCQLPEVQAYAAAGLDAVGGLIVTWSETADEIKARPHHVYSDMHDESDILLCMCKIRMCHDSLAVSATERYGELKRAS